MPSGGAVAGSASIAVKAAALREYRSKRRYPGLSTVR
jgi:hypothetical protein